MMWKAVLLTEGVDGGMPSNSALPTWMIYTVIGCSAVIILGIVMYSYSQIQKNKHQKLQKQVDDLASRKNKLFASTVEASLAKIRTFEQTERISTQYRNWLTMWQQTKTRLEKDMQQELLDLEDLLERHKFKLLPPKIDTMTTNITNIEQQVSVMEREIDEFVKNEAQIHKQFEVVKDALKQVAQLFFANQSSLDPYTKELENHLEEKDKMLYNILDSMDTQDKQVVAQELDSLQQAILNDYTLIKEMPNALALTSKVLLPQMQVLDKAYHEMLEQGFLFQGLNLNTRIEKMKDRIAEIQNLIAQFQLTDIEVKGIYVRKQIEEMHIMLVNEKNAKDDVIRQLEHINQKMNKLRFDKETFLDAWNKLIKRYEVDKDKLHHVDSFSAQVLSAETKTILFNNQFEKNQEAYVVLLDELRIFEQHLNELQYGLLQLQKIVESIKEDEVYINAQYKQLCYMHHRSKRKINQLPIDLLPDEYLLKNDEAILSLKEIAEYLTSDVLDVKRLTELIEIAQHLSIRFYKDTNMLIKAAAFAEKAIIYSNRYRFDPHVQRQLAKAEYLYNQGEYTESLDIALTTLEAVTPGIYSMLFQSYEAAIQKEDQ